jgi:hypothetical protein
MNYFEARCAEAAFRKYKDLALEYWRVAPEDTRDRLDIRAGASNPETEESITLRATINQILPEVTTYAHRLGVGVIVHSYPAPVVGGPVLPLNLLGSVVDRRRGHGPISVGMILDKMDECIGAAAFMRRRAFWRLVVPVFWIVDVPAVVIRIPFLILRAAGVPAKVEENIVSQILKVVIVILLLLVMGYLGLEKYITRVLEAFH